MRLCPKCKKEKNHFSGKICNPCYRRFVWKRKQVICKRCKRTIFHHARGYCAGCYNFLFRIDKIRIHNYTRKYNISWEKYLNITKRCAVCGFNKIVDLHHLDGNRKNNSDPNLIGLCPNHHKMFHTYKYQKEILESLNHSKSKQRKTKKSKKPIGHSLRKKLETILKQFSVKNKFCLP